MPAIYPAVVLAKDLERSLRLGHPWLWRDSLRIPKGLPHSAVVDIRNAAGRFVARGFYDSKAPLAVRVLGLDEQEIPDEAMLRRRFEQALRARSGIFDPSETNAWRCLHGEGDRLPGVVLDVYASVAVLRLEGPADPLWCEPIAVLARELLAVSHVLLRARDGQVRVVHGGELSNPVEIREHGVRFLVDVRHGQKTGFFIDQRDNRRAIRWHAAGQRVANLFGYTGGFSIHAVMAAAREVVTVDSAQPALDLARENFRLNGLDPDRHAFVRADAFAWLEEQRMARQSYGVVIVDPPSFAPSEKSLGPALEAYKKLNAAALQTLAPEGLLATASCSSHVSQARFVEIIARAAAAADRPLRVLDVRGQPADHPSLPAWPEGRYLDMVWARALG